MEVGGIILKILVAAMVGEAIWETLKMIWENGKYNIDKIGAIAVGLLIAFGAQLDIFAAAGIPLVIPYLGFVLTGILLSRGANFVHDLWQSVGSLKGLGERRLLRLKYDTKELVVSAKPKSPVTKIVDVAPKVKASVVGSVNTIKTVVPKKVAVTVAKVVKVIKPTS